MHQKVCLQDSMALQQSGSTQFESICPLTKCSSQLDHHFEQCSFPISVLSDCRYEEVCITSIGSQFMVELINSLGFRLIFFSISISLLVKEDVGNILEEKGARRVYEH